MPSSEYTPTAWVDDAAPAISAANLNHLEDGVEHAHERIDTLGASGADHKTLAEFAAIVPANQMEVSLILDGTAGVLAHLKYRSGSANADKWENDGSGKLCARSVATSFTGVAYGDPGTLLSHVTPRSGRYRIRFGAYLDSVGGAVPNLAVKLGASAIVDATHSLNPTGIANDFASTRDLEVDLVAGDVVKLQAKASAGALSIINQFLDLVIVRCS